MELDAVLETDLVLELTPVEGRTHVLVRDRASVCTLVVENVRVQLLIHAKETTRVVASIAAPPLNLVTALTRAGDMDRVLEKDHVLGHTQG